ncbi:MAG: holo-[acyl-carrier-protein] synthase [Candidatus Marinimicrobia bacterium]|nr:holo-[acyl-carrier-protein] synthase [Candidatus Neomarinimicrobiota bacterium]|tara:strand:+ start:3119 stop:3496 length:378 start_codon:yes stop_codon:yes gene_type:complete
MILMDISDIFIGTDIVDVSRVKLSLEKQGKRFRDRIFSNAEQNYCDEKPLPEIHFSGKFAAKESIIKAIKSSGYKKVIPFNKIEIINSEFGAPNVLLDIDLLGDCKVSISHTNTHAIAMAIFISA